MEGVDAFAFVLTEAWNEIINRTFYLCGFEVSFFQPFAYTVVGGILLNIVWSVFFDD